MQKDMIAKFRGKCRACHRSVDPGEAIRYLGKRNGSLCASCAGLTGETPHEDDAAGFERGTRANDRRLARNGLTVVRFANGETMTRNARGICEDAPCCGCCS